MKISAGIVLYHPNEKRLMELIHTILQQVALLVIYDNEETYENREIYSNDATNAYVDYLNKKAYDNKKSHNNQKMLRKEKYERLSEKIVYRSEGKNKGIAYALNQIMQVSRDYGYSWVVTLDQDTLIPDNIISVFKKNINDFPKAAVFAPQVIDKRRAYRTAEEKNNAEETDFCITSASCTKIEAWNEVGGYDNYLFIDFVDNDFCKRITICGYKIIKINSIIINQEFGEIERKSERKVRIYMALGRLLKNKNIAKLTYKKNVNPVRIYYVHRNLLYLNKKYKKYNGIGYRNFYCKSFIGFLCFFTLPSVIRAKKKLVVLKAVKNGFRDGIRAAKEVKEYE